MLGNKEIMARNIRHQMEIHNKTRNDVCTALGFSYTTFSDWCNAKKYPRIDKIEMMANYFGIEKKDLIEERKKPSELEEYLEDPDIRRLVLFAGGNIPRNDRQKVVDAIIFTIQAMNKKEGKDGIV